MWILWVFDGVLSVYYIYTALRIRRRFRTRAVEGDAIRRRAWACTGISRLRARLLRRLRLRPWTGAVEEGFDRLIAI